MIDERERVTNFRPLGGIEIEPIIMLTATNIIRTVAVVRSRSNLLLRTGGRVLSTATSSTSGSSHSHNQQNNNNHGSLFAAALLGTFSAAAATVTLLETAPPPPTTKPTKLEKETSVKAPLVQSQDSSKNASTNKPGVSNKNRPPPRPDLPTYTRDQVAEHCDEDSMWFTYRGAVYDLTFFLHGHPGGAPRVLMAAGQGRD